MKKILSLLLAAAMFATLVPSVVFADHAVTLDGDGGTGDSDIQVSRDEINKIVVTWNSQPFEDVSADPFSQMKYTVYRKQNIHLVGIGVYFFGTDPSEEKHSGMSVKPDGDNYTEEYYTAADDGDALTCIEGGLCVFTDTVNNIYNTTSIQIIDRAVTDASDWTVEPRSPNSILENEEYQYHVKLSSVGIGGTEYFSEETGVGICVVIPDSGADSDGVDFDSVTEEQCEKLESNGGESYMCQDPTPSCTGEPNWPQSTNLTDCEDPLVNGGAGGWDVTLSQFNSVDCSNAGGNWTGPGTWTPSTNGIHVDTDIKAPVITITGGDVTTVYLDSTYNDLSATAIDNVDGTVTVTSVGHDSVDTSTEGIYYVTYTATDALSNTDTAVRTVNVVPAPLTVVGAVDGDNLVSLTEDSGVTYLDVSNVFGGSVDPDAFTIARLACTGDDTTSTNPADCEDVSKNGGTGTWLNSEAIFDIDITNVGGGQITIELKEDAHTALTGDIDIALTAYDFANSSLTHTFSVSVAPESDPLSVKNDIALSYVCEGEDTTSTTKLKCESTIGGQGTWAKTGKEILHKLGDPEKKIDLAKVFEDGDNDFGGDVITYHMNDNGGCLNVTYADNQTDCENGPDGIAGTYYGDPNGIDDSYWYPSETFEYEPDTNVVNYNVVSGILSLDDVGPGSTNLQVIARSFLADGVTPADGTNVAVQNFSYRVVDGSIPAIPFCTDEGGGIPYSTTQAACENFTVNESTSGANDGGGTWGNQNLNDVVVAGSKMVGAEVTCWNNGVAQQVGITDNEGKVVFEVDVLCDEFTSAGGFALKEDESYEDNWVTLRTTDTGNNVELITPITTVQAALTTGNLVIDGLALNMFTVNPYDLPEGDIDRANLLAVFNDFAELIRADVLSAETGSTDDAQRTATADNTRDSLTTLINSGSTYSQAIEALGGTATALTNTNTNTNTNTDLPSPADASAGDVFAAMQSATSIADFIADKDSLRELMHQLKLKNKGMGGAMADAMWQMADNFMNDTAMTIDDSALSVGFDITNEDGTAFMSGAITEMQELCVENNTGECVLEFFVAPGLGSDSSTLNLDVEELIKSNFTTIVVAKATDAAGEPVETEKRVIVEDKIAICSKSDATTVKNMIGEDRVDCPSGQLIIVDRAVAELGGEEVAGFPIVVVGETAPGSGLYIVTLAGLYSAIGDGGDDGTPTITSTTADSDTQITVQWDDDADNDTGFKVYSSTVDPTSGSFAGWGTEIATVAGDGAPIGNSFSYINGTLIANTQYWYTVEAYNDQDIINGVDCSVNICTSSPSVADSATTQNGGGSGGGGSSVPEFSDYILMLTFLIAGFAVYKRMPELQAIVNKK